MITESEAALLELIGTILPAAASGQPGDIRELRGVPGGVWTLEALQRALTFSPGVYVAFAGCQGKPESVVLELIARWSVYVVTGHATEQARRTGGATTLGAYEIMQRLLPALHGQVLAGLGTLGVERIDNLFTERNFDLGGTVYGIRLALYLNPGC